MKTGWLGSPEPEAVPEVCDPILRDVLSAARDAYPTIDLPAEAFLAYLGERLPADVPTQLAVPQIRAVDLYLACACARGDVRALAAFDDHCVRPLDRVLSRMGIDADVIAEIQQNLRDRILVGDGKRPKIVDYAGRGDLRAWVRVMAVRWALRQRVRARRELPVEDDELLQRLVSTGDPATDHAKGLYRREFQRAFEDALRTLPTRELTLLRQHYVDELTIDELAALYRVHRATAARQLVRARALVLEATRARMMSELQVQPHELDSIMRMIQSQIEISLRGALRRRKR